MISKVSLRYSRGQPAHTAQLGKVDEISVDTRPTTVDSLYSGDSFDPAGLVLKVTFEDEHGEKTVEFDDDVDCVVIIDDDEGNVEIREGTCEDYEDSDDELDFYDDDDEEWF